MTYLGMYILTKLDSWRCFAGGTGLTLLIITIIASIILAPIIDCNKDYKEDFIKAYAKYAKVLRFKTLFIIAVSLTVFAQLLPTTKQAAFIYIAPQIIENGAVKDTFKNIPELTKLGTEYLKEILKEKIDDTQK
jgi:hypothetical protein